MKKTISDITNEQIIQSARRQRQSVNSRMEVEPWKPRHHHGRGIAAIITIAPANNSTIGTGRSGAARHHHDDRDNPGHRLSDAHCHQTYET